MVNINVTDLAPIEVPKPLLVLGCCRATKGDAI